MLVLKLAAGAAVVAALMFAVASFGTSGGTHTALASGISNIQCDTSNAHPGGGATASVTCTFDFRGSSHTLVVTFTDNDPAGPSRNDVVSGCTIDDRAIHYGPCP